MEAEQIVQRLDELAHLLVGQPRLLVQLSDPSQRRGGVIDLVEAHLVAGVRGVRSCHCHHLHSHRALMKR